MQVHAEPGQINGLPSRRKLRTYVFLRLRFARALGYTDVWTSDFGKYQKDIGMGYIEG